MRRTLVRVALVAASLLVPLALWGADISFPGGELTLSGDARPLTAPTRLLLTLTALSLAPSMLIALTAFTRIIIVLAMLRQAIGMPETPPNVVLLSLALFLTVFTMMPVWKAVNDVAVQPYLAGQLDEKAAFDGAMAPVREFMATQTRPKDLALMVELGGNAEPPENLEKVSTFHLVPAFMLCELRRAFEIGFVIFLPFIAIDIIVASVLMSLGMIMVPPLAFSLPLKVLLFVLIDGWSLLATALVKSFAVV